MLDEILIKLFSEAFLDSLRGKWVARIVVCLAVLAVAGVLWILLG